MDQLYYTCESCFESFTVKGEPQELLQLSALLQQLPRKCTTDGCPGPMKKMDHQILTQRFIGAKEFLAAVAGLGFPKERSASVEVIDALLRAHEIATIHLAESSDPTRSILVSIGLSDGFTLHLTAGPEGATIYKVTGYRDERSDPELQEASEDGAVRLRSSEVARGESASRDHGPADRGSLGQPAPDASAVHDEPGRLQETKG